MWVQLAVVLYLNVYGIYVGVVVSVVVLRSYNLVGTFVLGRT